MQPAHAHSAPSLASLPHLVFGIRKIDTPERLALAAIHHSPDDSVQRVEHGIMESMHPRAF